MEDERVWAFEESLWTADALHYQDSIDQQVLMALPTPPFILGGPEAIEAVTHTPRWSDVELTERRVSRPQEGLIVVAYHAHAAKEGETYRAWCTSTYRRLSHEEWRVVQHQQTPVLGS
jgi:hypothetical protein